MKKKSSHFITLNLTSHLDFNGQIASTVSKLSFDSILIFISILKIINYYELQWGSTLEDCGFWIQHLGQNL